MFFPRAHTHIHTIQYDTGVWNLHTNDENESTIKKIQRQKKKNENDEQKVQDEKEYDDVKKNGGKTEARENHKKTKNGKCNIISVVVIMHTQ